MNFNLLDISKVNLNSCLSHICIGGGGASSKDALEHFSDASYMVTPHYRANAPETSFRQKNM